MRQTNRKKEHDLIKKGHRDSVVLPGAGVNSVPARGVNCHGFPLRQYNVPHVVAVGPSREEASSLAVVGEADRQCPVGCVTVPVPVHPALDSCWVLTHEDPWRDDGCGDR